MNQGFGESPSRSFPQGSSLLNGHALLKPCGFQYLDGLAYLYTDEFLTNRNFPQQNWETSVASYTTRTFFFSEKNPGISRQP